ncbi:MAG: histidine kinase [Acidobacteria bacterium]|nr:histidine kinase [Acidobacteriota bacterium]
MMTAADAMDSGTRITARRTFSHYVPGVLIAQAVLSVVVALLIMPFQRTRSSAWSLFLGNFLYGLAYANCCGWLALFVMPRVMTRMSYGTQLHRWTVLITSLVLVGIGGSLAGGVVLAGLHVFPWPQYWGRFWGSLQMVLVISLVTGIVWFLFESMKFRAQYAASQARLASLESKVRPHFLFNTLNSIAALIPENPSAAERMTERLAALLRFSLDSSHDGTVPLEHEMKIVGDYLEIEKARFGDRINYAIDVPSQLTNRAVPPFSVQTLVENCVKYGGSEIRVTARESNGKLQLEVWDSGSGFASASIKPGHGLYNLRLRMALLWGARATLDVIQEDKGCRVRLTMPGVV